MLAVQLLRWLRLILWLVMFLAIGLFAYALWRPQPEDLPWTPLALDQPVGLFTGRKLTGLTRDRETCLGLVRATGLGVTEVPPFGTAQCRVEDGVRIAAGQEMLALTPASVTPSCPVVAALAMWHWQVVQPAAQRILGASVTRIEHLGSHNCRRLYGRSQGGWSQHATADAIDIRGFILSDGRRVSVLRDWPRPGREAAFLTLVRDGACDLFATVLSPDYNTQHRDHLHLDQAERGEKGWRACR